MAPSQIMKARKEVSCLPLPFLFLSVTRVDMKVNLFYFAKYEINTKLKFISLQFVTINVAKFRRQSFNVFFLFDLKHGPDLVLKVDLILHAP
jgi:hypothetical protein